MALLVTGAKFKNTEIEAPQMYVRLQYVAMADGMKTSVILKSGLNKETVLNWETVATNIPENLMISMESEDPATGVITIYNQDLLVIHDLVKADLELKGFTVVIDLQTPTV